MVKTFEEVEHTADWAFRAYGRDLRELFVNAATALFALQGSLEDTPPTVTREVRSEGIDRETLLVNWLNELLFLQETEHETYNRFEILELSDTDLYARIQGKPRGKMDKVIKAATFHDLEVRLTNEGWEATVVLDV